MASQGKAEKWFHETKKHFKHSLRGSHGKSVNYEKGMEIHTCTYCPKAFSDTRCLVMHILRRHSDNLVLLHENVRNLKNPSPSSTDVIKYIEAEFSDLKGELESVKKTVLDYLCSKTNDGEFPSTSDTPTRKPQSFGKTTDDSKDETSLSKKIHKPVHKPSKEIDSADFEAKLHDLFDTYKKDVLLKDVKTEIAANKNEILHEVRNNLLPEFQSVLLQHLNKNSLEWKASVSELKRDIAQLTQQVKSNTERINSPEALQKLEERFEQRLLSILNSGSLYGAPKKKKSAISKLRKKKGLFTKSSKTSKTCEDSGPHLGQDEISNPESTVLKRQETHSPPKMIEETKRIHMSDSKRPEDIPGPSCDKSNPRSSRRKTRGAFTMNSQGLVPAVHQRQSDTEKNIKLIVDEKMKCYNIHPHTERLTSEEFQKKMHLISSETQMLSHSVEGFSEVRDRLEWYVDRVAKANMKTKCPKKLRFSDSVETPKTRKNLEALLRPDPVLEREMSRSMGGCGAKDTHPMQEESPKARKNLEALFGPDPVLEREMPRSMGGCVSKDTHPMQEESLKARKNLEALLRPDPIQGKEMSRVILRDARPTQEESEKSSITPVLRPCDGGSGYVAGTRNLNKTYTEKERKDSKEEVAGFNPSTSNDPKTQSTVGSSQNFEDLSELSSLSDLED